MSRMRLIAVPVLAAAMSLAAATTASAATANITKAEYDKVKLGSSIATLKATAGTGACKLVDSSTSHGVTLKTYNCKGNKELSAASFFFTDNKLELKNEYGLDGFESNGKMTKAKYLKITKGKTVAQMKSIAGVGTCVKGGEASGIGGFHQVSYDCTQSSTFGAANFLVEKGKVVARGQFGLR